MDPSERRHLFGLAYRMLGTAADAEDAVQETYLRYYRLSDDERAAIREPRAWLTRVAGRVCLDALGSARRRRERYVGEWLPEPLPAHEPGSPDPLEQVSLDESVSTALLVVLDTLTPAERVAYVLHEVFAVPYAQIAEVVGRSPDACRQLAASARRRIREEGRAVPTPRDRHDEVVRAFVAACRGGDLAALLTVLDPAVALRSDGGGLVSAARRPVLGADPVARFLLGAIAKSHGTTVTERATGDGTALALERDGVVVGVANLGVADGVVSDVWLVLNPEKLGAWVR
ncbi:RNA polymerase sigma factor SigJ [Cellulosimicrobium sp. Marseille-Q4280]|uniref:RNA polymerase sigma factor SigJ n=1 Tax=Cellulosimicrobium sp. Marseille-Q4280 TaxID=2937992 RepID=UPI00255806F5|nr:RNA polymerase sigma factor SigJ [Cellulosimicrobium sp. Marseille-Q4280]